MSSPPCWWTKTKDLSLACFVRPPEVVHFTIVIGVSRGWLKASYYSSYLWIWKCSFESLETYSKSHLTVKLVLKNRDFLKYLRRRRRRKRHLTLSISLLRSFHLFMSWNVDRVSKKKKISTSGFRLKIDKERFTFECLRCRQILKFEDFTSMDEVYRKNMSWNACRTCSTIIFPF